MTLLCHISVLLEPIIHQCSLCHNTNFVPDRQPLNSAVKPEDLDRLTSFLCANCMLNTRKRHKGISRLNRKNKVVQLCIPLSLKHIKSLLVVMSSRMIPGNAKAVSRLINEMYRLGAEVLYESMHTIHASGHGYVEELRDMLEAVRPEIFVPVHGEYRHLKLHQELAMRLGMDEKNIQIPEIGDCFELKQKKLVKTGTVTAGNVYVDGLVDVDSLVLKDRQQLSNDGFVILLVTIGLETSSLLAPPEIITRGLQIAEEHVEPIKEIICTTVDKANYKGAQDRGKLKSTLRRQIERYISGKLKQRPMILPIITEVE